MNNIVLNGVDIDRNNIDDVYLDLKRNITITLKDNKKVIIQRTDGWKEMYKELTGYE